MCYWRASFEVYSLPLLGEIPLSFLAASYPCNSSPVAPVALLLCLPYHEGLFPKVNFFYIKLFLNYTPMTRKVIKTHSLTLFIYFCCCVLQLKYILFIAIWSLRISISLMWIKHKRLYIVSCYPLTRSCHIIFFN